MPGCATGGPTVGQRTAYAPIVSPNRISSLKPSGRPGSRSAGAGRCSSHVVYAGLSHPRRSACRLVPTESERSWTIGGHSAAGQSGLAVPSSGVARAAPPSDSPRRHADRAAQRASYCGPGPSNISPAVDEPPALLRVYWILAFARPRQRRGERVAAVGHDGDRATRPPVDIADLGRRTPNENAPGPWTALRPVIAAEGVPRKSPSSIRLPGDHLGSDNPLRHRLRRLRLRRRRRRRFRRWRRRGRRRGRRGPRRRLRI